MCREDLGFNPRQVEPWEAMGRGDLTQVLKGALWWLQREGQTAGEKIRGPGWRRGPGGQRWAAQGEDGGGGESG